MGDGKEGKAAAWSEAEKIIDKAGPIQWDGLILPEGRTMKAIQIMIGRERAKAKEARGIKIGEDGTPAVEGEDAITVATPKKGKRKAGEDAEGTPKKAKTPRKKKAVTASPDPGDEEEDGAAVRAEPGADES